MQPILIWLQNHTFELIVFNGVLIFLVILQRATGKVRRLFRRRRPLHPRLRPYAGRSDADVAAERRDAARIIATSSTGTVAGYDIVQQIEAVFVDGYRTPQEAAIGLKAAAVGKGANAIINLSQQRTGAGRSMAQGDAVIVRPQVAKDKPQAKERPA